MKERQVIEEWAKWSDGCGGTFRAGRIIEPNPPALLAPKDTPPNPHRRNSMVTVPKTYADSLERRVEHLTQALIEAARERHPEGSIADWIQRVKLVNKWKKLAHRRELEMRPTEPKSALEEK